MTTTTAGLTAADVAKYVVVLIVGAVLSIPIAITLLIDVLRGHLPAPLAPCSDEALPPRPACLDDPSKAGGSRVFFPANGRLFSSLQAGAGPGKPLMLCLHGFPENSYSWRHVLKHFAPRFHVVAIDLRGYGDTSRSEPSFFTRQDYRLEALVADVHAVAAALQGGMPKPFHLVAHDWGGMIAHGYAHAFPETLASLTIASAPHPISYEKNLSLAQAGRSWYIAFFQMPWLPEAFLARRGYAFIKAAFTGPASGVKNKANFDADDLAAMKYAFTRAGTLTAALNYYRNVLTSNQVYFRGLLARHRKIPVPMHLLWGAQDAALGVELTRGTDRMCSSPTYKLTVLEGASHWVQNDAVAEVLAAMDQFYATVPGAPGAAALPSAPVPAPAAVAAAALAAPAPVLPVPAAGEASAATKRNKGGRKH